MRKVVNAGGTRILLFMVFGGTVAVGTDVRDRNTDVRIKRTDG